MINTQSWFEQNKNKLNVNNIKLNGIAREAIYIGGFVQINIDTNTGECYIENYKE